MWRTAVAFLVYFGLLVAFHLRPGLIGGWSWFYYLSFPLVALAVFVVGLGGVLTWVYKRLRKQSPAWSPRASKGALGLGLCVLAVLVVQFLPRGLPSGSYERAFDRAGWSAPDAVDYVSGEITPRQKMLGDVVSRLPGLSRQEIEGLLGPQTDSDYFKASGRDLIYVLGIERDNPIGIDSEWLLIWFDDQGQFERYQIAVD